MGVVRVTDNREEEECRQSIGGRWEEECAAPNFVTKIIFAGFPVTRGRAPSPCLLISNINRLTGILQCNIIMLPMQKSHGLRVWSVY